MHFGNTGIRSRAITFAETCRPPPSSRKHTKLKKIVQEQNILDTNADALTKSVLHKQNTIQEQHTNSKVDDSVEKSFSIHSGKMKIFNKRQLFSPCQTIRSECKVSYQNNYLLKTVFVQPRDQNEQNQCLPVDLVEIRRAKLLKQLKDLQVKSTNLVETSEIQSFYPQIDDNHSKKNENKVEQIEKSPTIKSFSEKINQLKKLELYSIQMKGISNQLQDIDHAITQDIQKRQSMSSKGSPYLESCPLRQNSPKSKFDKVEVFQQQQALMSKNSSTMLKSSSTNNFIQSTQVIPKRSQSPFIDLNRSSNDTPTFSLKKLFPPSQTPTRSVKFGLQNETFQRYLNNNENTNSSSSNKNLIADHDATSQSIQSQKKPTIQLSPSCLKKIKIFDDSIDSLNQNQSQNLGDVAPKSMFRSPKSQKDMKVELYFGENTINKTKDYSQNDLMNRIIPMWSNKKGSGKKPISEGLKKLTTRSSLNLYQLKRTTRIKLRTSLLHFLKKLTRMKISLEEFCSKKKEIFMETPLQRIGSLIFFKSIKANNLAAVSKITSKCRYFVFDFDMKRQTCLHKVLRSGNSQMLSLFISLGADVEAEDIFGKKPIYYAIRLQNLECLKILLEANADPWNTKQDNYLSLAAGNNQIIILLKQYKKAKFNNYFQKSLRKIR